MLEASYPNIDYGAVTYPNIDYGAVTNNSKHVRLALRNNTSKTKAFNKG